MALKVISLDFWNTIFDSSNGTNRNKIRKLTIYKELEDYEFVLTDELFDKALKESWAYFNNIWMNQQRTPQAEDTIQFFWKYLGLPHNPGAIERITRVFSDSILDFPPKLNDGIIDVLPKLAEKYKLGIVSDTGFTPGSILRILLKDFDIFKYFSAFSFSDETGVSKPHPKAFSTILEQLDCLPQNSVHIGDIEKTDIVGAKKIGMKAILYNGDKTAQFNKDNTPTTLAEFESNNWNEIYNLILDLDS